MLSLADRILQTRLRGGIIRPSRHRSIVLLPATNKASEKQTKEIIQIVYGKTKGDCFALFAGILSRFLEPQFVDINAKIDGRKRVAFLNQYNEWFQILEINLLFIF